ncbi:tetratricopeptide repeat protein [Desulforhopalus vacuolatus]|uniref:tetratricopeptide repeat protein n=1 Tax=Desulforhopalus vacuolatus TaxID=40414 RepID=UPI0019652042|nr:tetratricopeptide repeat protein [Desulforhopalus vacuolatus]MBM9519542.1 tetratricopeptide repeat protein [Desulforhopalus vacuolatus]
MQNAKKKTSLIIYAIIIFVLGFLSGAGFAVWKTNSSGDTMPVSAAGLQSTNPPAVSELVKIVASEPANASAWLQLGNLYFDVNAPAKAIDAYTHTISLGRVDANILTDLGVMYRRSGQPEKAVESFDKAIQRDPQHTIAFFNKGTVQLYDLHQSEEAVKTWEAVLLFAPEATVHNGTPLKKIIAQTKADITAAEQQQNAQ